jgi:hypothetical protein
MLAFGLLDAQVLLREFAVLGQYLAEALLRDASRIEFSMSMCIAPPR